MNYKFLVILFILCSIGVLLPPFLMGDISLNDSDSIAFALILVGVIFTCMTLGIVITKIFNAGEIAFEKADAKFAITDKLKYFFKLTLVPSIAIGVVGIGILEMPYNYYVLVRWTVFIVGLVFGSYLHQQGNRMWLVMIFWSILYNPFMPFYLSREMWLPINIITIISFLYFPFSVYKNAKIGISSIK